MNSATDKSRTARALRAASDAEIDELDSYNRNTFDRAQWPASVVFPLEDEPFVEAWRECARIANQGEVFEYLKSQLVQFNFPIREGMSQTENYKSAVRGGAATEGMSEAIGLELQHPEDLRLIIHPTLAGCIPILATGERRDFVSLVRALLMRNEPGAVPDSMGAAMVSGYNNWGRIRGYRKRWEAGRPGSSEEEWKSEFASLIPRRELYQDRFILLGEGPYSGVSARDMGLPEEEWKRISFVIRREHECTHYFTRRVFSSMRNNLHDEIIADYMGILAAAGRYRAGWLLRFMGLEAFPHYRQGGRLENYRGDPPLSENAFKLLQTMVKDAAENLERLSEDHAGDLRTPFGRIRMLTAMTRMRLDDLASNEASSLFGRAWSELAFSPLPSEAEQCSNHSIV